MKLVVGLRNFDRKYENTFHNVGEIFVKSLNEYMNNKFTHHSKFKGEKKVQAEVSVHNITHESANKSSQKVILCLPKSYMNTSGTTVSKLVNYYKINLDDLIVAHDDADLNQGDIRVVTNRGSAGHHGIEDIFQKINSKNFTRVRIGIGRPKINKFDISSFVLTKVSNTLLDTIHTFSYEDFYDTYLKS